MVLPTRKHGVPRTLLTPGHAQFLPPPCADWHATLMISCVALTEGLSSRRKQATDYPRCTPIHTHTQPDGWNLEHYPKKGIWVFVAKEAHLTTCREGRNHVQQENLGYFSQSLYALRTFSSNSNNQLFFISRSAANLIFLEGSEVTQAWHMVGTRYPFVKWQWTNG